MSYGGRPRGGIHNRSTAILNLYGQDYYHVAIDMLTYKIDRELEEEAMHLGYRHLVGDGVWLVPPGERFEGWEKLGVREPTIWKNQLAAKVAR